ncbi:MAG: GTPase [Dermatophilaceae bacterium]
MRRRERHPAPPLTDRTAALRQSVAGLMGALDAGYSHLPPERVASAEAVVAKVAARLSLSSGHTVVALAGATGGGKSSLFNALVGESIAKVGVLRPTTSRISAAAWGPDSASDLLDWVGAEQRHHVAPGRTGAQGWGSAPGGGTEPDGLVLLDLPDVDSFKEEHRAEADRVLALADVFVWVTDPQKYADALVHEQYLRRASRHETVTLVVLNQADRMTPEEGEECAADLRRLLADDGLPATDVLLSSTRTGQGLPELRDALAGAAGAASAARARLLGDVQREADALAPHVGNSEPTVDETVSDELLEALSRAAGIPVVLASVEADYRQQAGRRVGWPYARWIHRLRPDPLKRLRLDGAGPSPADVAVLLGRSSLPQPTPAARAAVDLTTRKLGTRASSGMPSRWARAVQDAATPDRAGLGDALDQAILRTQLRDRPPLWWALVNALHIVFALAAAAGLIWLLILAGFGFLRIQAGDVPSWNSLPVPTLLLGGGVLLGILLGGLAKPLVRVGARRRRETVEQRLRERVSDVARGHLLAPVRAVLDAHRRTREGLSAARAA